MRREFSARVKRRPLPSREKIHDILRYDADTGKLYRRETGEPAINTPNGGHLRGHLLGVKVYAHRVIWKMVYGTEPEHLDHIDGDGENNRLSNLREVSHQQNCQNRAMRRTNLSGRTGVSWEQRLGKWRASIFLHGRNKYLGLFDSFEEASARRAVAEKESGFGPSHGRERHE